MLYGEFTLILGVILGFCLSFSFALFLTAFQKNQFKKYYLYQNDNEKTEIINRLENIRMELETLQKKSNDRYIRNKFNSFIDLIASLRKRNMD